MTKTINHNADIDNIIARSSRTSPKVILYRFLIESASTACIFLSMFMLCFGSLGTNEVTYCVAWSSIITLIAVAAINTTSPGADKKKQPGSPILEQTDRSLFNRLLRKIFIQSFFCIYCWLFAANALIQIFAMLIGLGTYQKAFGTIASFVFACMLAVLDFGFDVIGFEQKMGE